MKVSPEQNDRQAQFTRSTYFNKRVGRRLVWPTELEVFAGDDLDALLDDLRGAEDDLGL